MVGDSLNYFLFLAGIALAGVAGGLQTVGWRSRFFWCLAVVSLVAMVAYWRAETTGRVILGIQTVWSLAPFMSVFLALIAASGREPRKPPLKEALIAKPRPVFNPALTADHLQSLISGSTNLESKRKIEAIGYQTARLQGKVEQISQQIDHIDVGMLGVFSGQGNERYNRINMYFKNDQVDSLAVIKQGEWIEFEGIVRPCSFQGWKLIECEFVRRSDPPARPRTMRKRPSQ